MTEPLPLHFDYQGNERLPAYVRGVTNVRCRRCNTSGVDPKRHGHNFLEGSVDTGIPVCRSCGGYGDVPRNQALANAFDAASDAAEQTTAAFDALGKAFTGFRAAQTP